MSNNIKKDGVSIYEYDSTLRNIELECTNCKKWTTRKIFQKKFLTIPFLCRTCNQLGERNPMYGKTISDETKHKKSIAMSGEKNPMYGKAWYFNLVQKYGEEEAKLRIQSHNLKISSAVSGENNGFYGKEHSIESKQKMSTTIQQTFANWSVDKKKQFSKSCSIGQVNRRIKDIEFHSTQMRKAGRAGFISQKKFNKKTRPEQLFYQLLVDLGLIENIDFEYSVVIEKYQYDFLLHKQRILIEIHGDYWHANPTMYTENILTMQQQINVAKDVDKARLAKDKNFELLIYWQSELENESKKEEIKNEILSKTNRNN